MEPEILEWIAKSLGGGLLSYIAQRILRNSEARLQELQSRSLNASDQDTEELLGHLVEELESLGDLSFRDSLRVIRLRMEVSRAYLRIRAERLEAGQGKPGGT